jgi:hypothetical protein
MGVHGAVLMTPNFLIGAVIGSAFAIFGLGRPARRLLQEWRARRED